MRALLRRGHRVLGLAVGLFLVITGLTGSALVFRHEIDTALNPRLLRVTPAERRAPIQPIVDRVARVFPDETPTRVRMPQRADGTYEFWLGSAPDLYVYADPYSGEILGARRPTEFLTGWLFLVHSQLLSGEPGKTFAGIVALVLVALSLSGLVVWWPRRAPWRAWSQWRAGLTVARGASGSRVAFDLHRAVGFYASLLLFVAGVSGASLVFHEAFERGAHWITFSTPAPGEPALLRAAAPASDALPADSLLAIAERALPGGTIAYLYLPAAPGQSFRVRKRLPGEEHPNGKSFVHVEPATGEVRATEDGSRAVRGARLYSILYPLHIGVLAGAWTRALALLTGLSLPVLAVTGVLVWWRRRRRARGAPLVANANGGVRGRQDAARVA